MVTYPATPVSFAHEGHNLVGLLMASGRDPADGKAFSVVIVPDRGEIKTKATPFRWHGKDMPTDGLADPHVYDALADDGNPHTTE